MTASPTLSQDPHHTPLAFLQAPTRSSSPCSVCLEVVDDDGERSIAKLKCGHHFHLDCIGSAFNAKGRMQCPNCRQVEHGQWLYANSCYWHENFVDDLTYEDDAEVYGGTTNSFGHIPWCPHPSSYAHLLLAFEEIDHTVNGYVNTMVPTRQGSRTPVVGRICPYLVAQGLSLGGPVQHAEEFLDLQRGRHSRRNTSRSVNSSSAHRSHWQQQASADSDSTSIPTSYEGYSQNHSPHGSFLQPRANRHQTAGIFLGNAPSVQAGANRVQNHGGNSGPFLNQPSQSRNAQEMYINTHFNLPSASQNGYFGSMQSGHNAMGSISSQRTLPVSSPERVWVDEQVHGNGPLGASSSDLGQSSNQLHEGDGMGWATDNQIDCWTRATDDHQAHFGPSNQWWAWLPSGNTLGQRGISNMQNTYPGLFPSSAGSSHAFFEHVSEGAYTWIPPGFC